MPFWRTWSIPNSLQKRDGDEAVFYQAKIDTARFYFERILPQTSSLYANIMAGSKGMMKFNEEAF